MRGSAKRSVAVGPGETHSSGQGQGAPVDEVQTVAVHEIRKARGAADAGNGHDLLVGNLEALEDFVE